jgi:hypothetical protein
MDTRERRDDLEAQISVGMDLAEKALASLTIAWKEQEAIGLTSYALFALRRANDLFADAVANCSTLRVVLRQEEDLAEGTQRHTA